MAKIRKPFWKQSHKAFYWKNDQGRLERLGATEGEAYARWERIRKGEAAPAPGPGPAADPSPGLTVSKLAETYLEWVSRNRDKATHESYSRILKPLKAIFGKETAVDIRPKHLDSVITQKLTTYKDGNGMLKRYSDSTKWQFYKATTAMYNWAKEQGHIESHALSRIKDRPECNVRQDWINQEQFDQLIAACGDAELRELLTVLWDSGARPFEVLMAQAKHLDRESRCLRFARAKGDKVKAKRKKKDATRTVRLSERAYEIVSRLADKYPEDILFRNSFGCKWTSSLISHRLKILRKRTGIKLTMYTLRHAFCTRLILANVNIRKIQELMGHSDLKMIAAVYAHLNKADDDLNGVLDRLAG